MKKITKGTSKKDRCSGDRQHNKSWQDVAGSIEVLMVSRDPHFEQEGSRKRANYLPELARELICFFYEQLKGDEHIEHEILCAYLKYILIDYVEHGYSLDQAFGLEQSKCDSNVKDTTERDIQIAAKVAFLRKACGYTYEVAVEMVAEEYSLSETTIRTQVRKYSDFGHLPPSVLKDVFE